MSNGAVPLKINGMTAPSDTNIIPPASSSKFLSTQNACSTFS